MQSATARDPVGFAGPVCLEQGKFGLPPDAISALRSGAPLPGRSSRLRVLLLCDGVASLDGAQLSGVLEALCGGPAEAEWAPDSLRIILACRAGDSGAHRALVGRYSQQVILPLTAEQVRASRL